MVQQLLYAGAGVNFQNEATNFTPLMEACLLKNFDICQLLLNHSANVNISCGPSFDGDLSRPTALFWAGQVGDLEIVKLLLQYRAHILDRSLQRVQKAIGISPIASPFLDDRSDILKLCLDYYKTKREHIYFLCFLDLFDEAMDSGREKCAIVILKEGYCPVGEYVYMLHFLMAACHGLIKLMSLLVGMNAQFPARILAHTKAGSWQTCATPRLCFMAV